MVCAILVVAVIILHPIDSGTVSAGAVLILALPVLWLLLSTVALGIYFYRAWQRVPLVPNKTSYIAWLGFETVCMLAMVGGLVWLFASTEHADSVPKCAKQLSDQTCSRCAPCSINTLLTSRKDLTRSATLC
jgi:hypothetical protein